MTTSSGSEAQRSSLTSRLLLLAKESGLGEREFERRCSLSPRFLTRSRQRLSAAAARKILRAFPGLSRKWLLCGRGPMLQKRPRAGKARPRAALSDQSATETLRALGLLASGALAIADAAVSLAKAVKENIDQNKLT